MQIVLNEESIKHARRPYRHEDPAIMEVEFDETEPTVKVDLRVPRSCRTERDDDRNIHIYFWMSSAEFGELVTHLVEAAVTPPEEKLDV